MRPQQIEAWVLAILDRVNRGQRVEDSRVELKADWPDPAKAARRIAGHANASGGEAVLWVIGLDEDYGVVSVTETDLAQWRSRIAAEFDGIEPAMTDLIVPTSGGKLWALLFDTS